VQVYDIVVAVDTREQFDLCVGGGPAKRKNDALAMHVEHMRAHGLAVEPTTLPVGDVAWFARCKATVPGGPLIGAMLMPALRAPAGTAHTCTRCWCAMKAR
jgi:hypothetical protein